MDLFTNVGIPVAAVLGWELGRFTYRRARIRLRRPLLRPALPLRPLPQDYLLRVAMGGRPSPDCAAGPRCCGAAANGLIPCQPTVDYCERML